MWYEKISSKSVSAVKRVLSLRYLITKGSPLYKPYWIPWTALPFTFIDTLQIYLFYCVTK